MREITKGEKTLYLDYEAYESMAIKQMQLIEGELKEKWGDIEISISHRIGVLYPTDIAVVLAVSTPHRKESYAANQYAMERLKKTIPIWKKEYHEDGSVWVSGTP